MPLTLRPYQEKIIAEARDLMRADVRRLVIVSPTGSGKTALGSFMIGNAATKGKRVWWLVHRRELLEQTSRVFENVGIPHAMVMAGTAMDYSCPVQICSVQTLANRLDDMPPPDMIVIDECHHSRAATYLQILERYPKAFLIGLTATPRRLDGRGLGTSFDRIIEGPEVRWLIEQGYLSKFKIFASPEHLDFSGIKTRQGDYANDELAAACDKPKLIGDIVQHYRNIADGRRAIVAAVNIAHSEHIAAEFVRAGYRAAHVDGKTNKWLRKELFADFAAGRLTVLSQVDLAGEGLDIPGIEVGIMARPTKSLTIYLQFIGRALRPSGDKIATIIDHAGNVFQHGMPDEPREWSLEDSKKKKPPAPITTMCPNCFAMLGGRPKSCPECGTVLAEGKEDAEPLEHAPGALVEADEAMVNQGRPWNYKRELQMARDIPSLANIAKIRGYKKGWIAAVLKTRGETIDWRAIARAMSA